MMLSIVFAWILAPMKPPWWVWVALGAHAFYGLIKWAMKFADWSYNL